MAIPASFPPGVRSAAYDPRVRVRAGAAQPPEALASAEPRGDSTYAFLPGRPAVPSGLGIPVRTDVVVVLVEDP